MSHSHDHAHGADAHAPHEQKNQDAELLEAVKAAAESMKAPGKSPLPVTVLSGFLGAGKTTLMTQKPAQKFVVATPSNHRVGPGHVLNNREGLKVAVIVNDMADVNVDANLLTDVVQAEEKMVALSNGCICCAPRRLSSRSAKLASKPDGLDHILIESSGISEPLPVAETFTFKDAAGTSLGSIPKLDTFVTVVDGSSFMDRLPGRRRPQGPRLASATEDQRTIAQLFCDQVEFANVIVVNKCDLTGRRRPISAPRLPQAREPQSQGRRVDLRPRRPQASCAASLLRGARRGGHSRRDSRYHACAGCSARTCSRYRKRSNIPIG